MGGCGGGHDRQEEESEEHGRHRGERAGGRSKDPVCGMAVEVTAAKTSVYRGQTYYFCSNECREKFEATPTSYAMADKGGCC
ncbi:MAG: YHS domain-containing protein [Nitrospirota bacterium]